MDVQCHRVSSQRSDRDGKQITDTSLYVIYKSSHPEIPITYECYDYRHKLRL